MWRLGDPGPRTVLLVAAGLALAPAFVIGVGLALALVLGDRSPARSELFLFELEAWAIWIGAIVVALLVYNHKRHL